MFMCTHKKKLYSVIFYANNNGIFPFFPTKTGDERDWCKERRITLTLKCWNICSKIYIYEHIFNFFFIYSRSNVRIYNLFELVKWTCLLPSLLSVGDTSDYLPMSFTDAINTIFFFPLINSTEFHWVVEFNVAIAWMLSIWKCSLSHNPFNQPIDRL